MKKLSLIIIVLATVSASTIVSSCSGINAPVSEPIPDDETVYEVRLNLAGEYTEITEELLGRTDENTPKKYYGINVFCMKTDGTQSAYSKYAYGVFDNVADMKITLLGGYKYKFECTSVKDDTHELNVDNSGCVDSPFCNFDLYGNENAQHIDNKFIISQSSCLEGIISGESYTKNVGYSNYPSLDRYYGELENFIPSAGATVNIPMKRTVFGIKFVINGVPDGNLLWSVHDLSFIYNQYEGTDKLEFSQIFTFYHVYDCWKSADTFTEDFNIGFSWIRANGYEERFTETITAKRNVMTVVTISLTGDDNGVSIGVNEDNTPMSNEYVNISYDGGNMNNTPVNP